jgi:RimJ/RimL family protein N-acetyltransferase
VGGAGEADRQGRRDGAAGAAARPFRRLARDRGALDLGFSYGLPEIHAIAWPGNERSLAVMRRLGMQSQGRTSKWFARETEHYKISRPRAGS